ncbi:gamma-glutamyltransferase [Helicobacter didelphidarum]|uniref:Glutathione hydrolase proenzyme n=1 Tax=Helicobacter didelphidarum TaxID=2040648 RepID=A0A3D8IJ94_9HELI|nr:gamma-glutamyltransferase [Helicobacter didelphidarum]RDU65005.1 gamma-glutamyltransferase [Helicobacter didelphidarum]
MLFCLTCFLVINKSLYAASYPPIRDMNGTGLAMTSSEYATKIGKSVLDNGGNAIDAAVAVGYALAVVHPAAGNIGGGGFAVIHLANGEDIALDFRESAPLASTKDMFLDTKGNIIPEASTIGYLSAGIPGTVKGMSAMLDKYGTKKLSELIQPAIDLAENGFVITDRQAETMLEAKKYFEKFASSKHYFLKQDGTTYRGGETLVQKDLAKTLRLIQKEGESAFYQGKIADLIAIDMKNNGGIITKEDLANYKVIWRTPVKGKYRGYDIVSMSPPSSGGTHIIEILNTIENANVKELGFNSAQNIHILAEAMRQAYADRAVFMGDPDFWEVPLSSLLSKEYAKKIYANIQKAQGKAISSKNIKAGLDTIKQGVPKSMKEGNHTTHYSVADKWGNAVSVTYTINGSYGAMAAVQGAGFLLNNEMDDFSIKPGAANLYGLVGGDANAIEPNKRPLSSMSPTIILKDNKLFMVVGSPGGARIITTVLQVISNIIDHQMDLGKAVESPRIHMQWQPDEIRIESFGLSKDTQNILKKMGYSLTELPDMGDVNAILRDSKTGIFYGVTDPRKEF